MYFHSSILKCTNSQPYIMYIPLLYTEKYYSTMKEAPFYSERTSPYFSEIRANRR